MQFCSHLHCPHSFIFSEKWWLTIWPRSKLLFFVCMSLFHWLPGLCCRRGYCYFLLHLEKRQRTYIVWIYAGFLQERSFFLGTKQGFFSSAFFPHLSEKPAQLMSDAFSFCNFVYWFSIHINIPVYNSVFLTKQMAWAILYLKLEATFLIGICSVGFASLVFIHWYTLRVRDGAMCSQHYLAVKCINLALGWLKTLTFIYFDPFAYSHVASTVL